MKRILTDWAFHIVLSAVTLVVLVSGLLGLTFASALSRPSPPLQAPSHPSRNSEIIAAFHDAGLTADVVRGATKDERDGFATWLAVEATPFQLSSRQEERGMLLAFNDPADLEKIRAYYLELNKSLPRYSSWLFVQDNILLQINGEVLEARAKEYAAVLESLGEW